MVDAPNGSGTKDQRKTDTLMDRRKGEDRRRVYDADYFENGGPERRKTRERRRRDERRKECVRVSKWSSICPDDGRNEGDEHTAQPKNLDEPTNIERRKRKKT